MTDPKSLPPHRPEVRTYARRIVSETDLGCILDCGHTYSHRSDCKANNAWHHCKTCAALAQAVPVEVRGGDAEGLHRAERDGVPGDDGADLTDKSARGVKA